MGEVSYAPVIKDMVWSYSRIKAFEDCPYRWYLRYIRQLPGKDMFFANYGIFMHKLIEQHYSEGKTSVQLCDTYLHDFRKAVKGRAPNKKVFENYFKDGFAYLKSFRPFPYKALCVEKKVEFNIDAIPLVGYIDYVGELNDKILVIDNKSRGLKPRSSRTKPTKTDEDLDNYLRQLYLYSVAVESEFGKRPKSLCFNCFRTSVFIEEPFQEQAYAESKKWFTDKVEEITYETEFRPDMEYFKCRHLCEMNDYCEYYNISRRR